MAVTDESLVIPGRGALFLAAKNTPLPTTEDLAKFKSITADSTGLPAGWSNAGHTSSDDLFSLAVDGGDATVMRTWLKAAVRTIYADQNWSITGNSVQWDKDTLLKLTAGWEHTATGGVIVPASKAASEQALLLVATDGQEYLGVYAPNAALALSGGPSFDLEQFAELPFTGNFQAADPAALPLSANGEQGIFEILPPSVWEAQAPTP